MNNKLYSVYLKSLLKTRIYLDITEIGKNLKQTLERKLIQCISNKCIPEGYVSPKDIKIIQYSSGTITANQVMYHVAYECLIAHPVEGMLINAKTKTITKAGIHAQVIDSDGNIPITVFIARDHNFSNSMFHNVKDNDMITVKVIGIRYELNDPYICVIANIYTEPSKVKKNVQLGGMNLDILDGDDDYKEVEDVMNINNDGRDCLSNV